MSMVNVVNVQRRVLNRSGRPTEVYPIMSANVPYSHLERPGGAISGTRTLLEKKKTRARGPENDFHNLEDGLSLLENSHNVFPSAISAVSLFLILDTSLPKYPQSTAPLGAPLLGPKRRTISPRIIPITKS